MGKEMLKANVINEYPFFIKYGSTIDENEIVSKYYHPEYELVFLMSGERHYFVNHRTYQMMPGDLLIVSPNDLHKPIDNLSLAHDEISIHFGKEFLKGFDSSIHDIEIFNLFQKKVHLLRFQDEDMKLVKTLFDKMIEEQQNSHPGHWTTIKMLLIGLLIFLNRHFSRFQSPEASKYCCTLHERISCIAEYIYGHYRSNITLTSVAGQFCLNPYYLSRVFKEVTGFSFIEYLNCLKIREVERLLKFTDLSVTDIAQKVGYRSITHLERVFKSLNGCSPSTFRKNLK